MEIGIRPGEPEDAAALAAIYNREVVTSLNNYESREQTTEDRAAWLQRLQQGNYPVVVATVEGAVAGFGALTPFHPLSGYRFTVTGSVYVSATYRRLGVGTSIGSALIAAARSKGFHSILAGINSENTASIRAHEKMGFRQVGHFREIGFKNGRWLDDVCLQLIL